LKKASILFGTFGAILSLISSIFLVFHESMGISFGFDNWTLIGLFYHNYFLRLFLVFIQSIIGIIILITIY